MEKQQRTDYIRNVIELGLVCSHEPLEMQKLVAMFDKQENITTAEVQVAIKQLEVDWAGRALEVVKVAGGWKLRTRQDFSRQIRKLQLQSPARLSRPLLEVLAIVAYKQSVTRGDIEAIRGVSTSSNHLATLEELGWVEVVGRKEKPGRPLLYGTTKQFLVDLGIDNLDQLPPLEDLIPEENLDQVRH